MQPTNSANGDDDNDYVCDVWQMVTCQNRLVCTNGLVEKERFGQLDDYMS